MSNPLPEEIKAARKKAGLTQAKAAQLVNVTPRTWKYWEAGQRSMPPSALELFQIKANQSAH